jgi:IMP dehydrogenase
MIHIITNMNMDHKFPLALSYDDVLLVPQYSDITSRNDVNLTTKITSKLSLKVPLISANMSDVTGSVLACAMARLGGLGVIPRFMPAEDEANLVSIVKKENLIVGAAIGIRNGMYDRSETLINAGADILVLDVAHGHMLKVIEAVANFKNKFRDVDLVAGNVATKEAAEALFKAGADSVKVGIGPGSICTTRIETGSGVPQITAILEAAKAAQKYKKSLIADGGVKNSGDIVKGLAAGASAIMAGSIFAGTDEAPGKMVKINGITYKNYNASTSLTEKKNHVQKDKDEFEKNYTKQIEGVESLVPYKGPLKPVIDKIVANLRSGLSYSGARNIEIFWKKAKFVQITAMGRRESEAHDVILAS